MIEVLKQKKFTQIFERHKKNEEEEVKTMYV